MHVYGVDPSSKLLAVAHGNDTAVEFEAHTLERGAQGAWQAYEFISGLLATSSSDDTLLAMEQPLVGRGGVRSTLVQAYISGAVQAAAVARSVPLLLVNVQTWKKDVIHNGNADKDRVRAVLEEEKPMEARAIHAFGRHEQDLFDALGLQLYGLRVLVKRRHLLDGALDVPE